jgi:hypothetical protein
MFLSTYITKSIRLHQFGNLKLNTIILCYLHAVNRQTGPSVESLVADVAFEMLGLLMLNKNLLIIKFSVAVPDNLRVKVNVCLRSTSLRSYGIHLLAFNAHNLLQKCYDTDFRLIKGFCWSSTCSVDYF